MPSPNTTRSTWATTLPQTTQSGYESPSLLFGTRRKREYYCQQPLPGHVIKRSRPMERDTEQRRAIRGVFTEVDRPLAPSEVLEASKRYVPTMGMATVYRNLKLLIEDGWLSSVELPGEPDRYERAGKGHHHHFVCQDCEQAFDIEACATDVGSMVPEGFEVTSHHLTLYGVCAGCA